MFFNPQNLSVQPILLYTQSTNPLIFSQYPFLQKPLQSLPQSSHLLTKSINPHSQIQAKVKFSFILKKLKLLLAENKRDLVIEMVRGWRSSCGLESNRGWWRRGRRNLRWSCFGMDEGIEIGEGGSLRFWGKISGRGFSFLVVVVGRARFKDILRGRWLNWCTRVLMSARGRIVRESLSDLEFFNSF